MSITCVSEFKSPGSEVPLALHVRRRTITQISPSMQHLFTEHAQL